MTCILSDTEAQRVFMYSIPDSDLSPVHDLINIFFDADFGQISLIFGADFGNYDIKSTVIREALPVP